MDNPVSATTSQDDGTTADRSHESEDMEVDPYAPQKRKLTPWDDMEAIKRSRTSSVVDMLQALIRLIEMTPASSPSQ